VLRQLRVRRIDLRVVAIRTADGAAQLVGHRHLGHTAEEFQRAHRRRAEILQPLRPRRLRECVVQGAQHRDEELDLDRLARLRRPDPWLLARVIDEDLLAGAVHLAHRQVIARSPFKYSPIKSIRSSTRDRSFQPISSPFGERTSSARSVSPM
jgi:hypothetical protein